LFADSATQCRDDGVVARDGDGVALLERAALLSGQGSDPDGKVGVLVEEAGGDA
jgi:hypothetical protein